MSHIKIRSEGYVAYSWEEKPGVCKSNHLNKSESFSDSDRGTGITPPPPCSSTFQPRRRESFSHKALWWQDDPFLDALKSCTENVPKYESIRRKCNESCNKWKNIISKSTSGFSCKQSCNVVTDNFDKFPKLPPLPKERYKAKSFVMNISNINN